MPFPQTLHPLYQFIVVYRPLPHAISSSVAKMEWYIRMLRLMAFTAPYLLAYMCLTIECEIDSVCGCKGCLSWCSCLCYHMNTAWTLVVNKKTCIVSSRSYLYPPMPTSVSHFSDVLLLPWPLLTLDTSPVLGLRYNPLQIKAEIKATHSLNLAVLDLSFSSYHMYLSHSVFQFWVLQVIAEND